MADENKNKPMSLVNDTFRTLRNDVVVVGKARVRSWHAWLAIGLAVGDDDNIVPESSKSIIY